MGSWVGVVRGRDGGRSFRKAAVVKGKDLSAYKKGLQVPSILDYSLFVHELNIFLLAPSDCLYSVYLVPCHPPPHPAKGRQRAREEGENLKSVVSFMRNS